jgi:hypothetical protein
MSRSHELQRFIDLLETAIIRRLTPGTIEWRVAKEIFSDLKASGEPGAVTKQEPLPALRHLSPALNIARNAEADLAAVADAFDLLQSQLDWYRRENGETLGQAFLDSHANAVIIGATGLERRLDVRVGVSLMAPGIQYVDHHHPPAEIYLVMTPGAWRQEQRPWAEPGIGGIVYNQPHVIHAMKSGEQPLFAIWCLLNRTLDGEKDASTPG